MSTNAANPCEVRISIAKKDAAKQLVWGVVYMPYVPDSQGDFMSPEEIERVAHNFLKKGAVDAIDTEHSLERNGSKVVESFVTREGDPDFPVVGSWVLGVHIPDKAAWAKAENGEIGGFSMYGTGRRQQRLVEIEVPDDGVIFVKSEASAAPGEHVHMCALDFDAQAKFLGGETDVVNGHSHLIRKGTVTETGPDGHRHRFNFIDLLAKGCSGLTDEQKAWQKKRRQMRKGDFPGHPFRGNQYVDGDGGGMSISDGNPLGAGGGGGGRMAVTYETAMAAGKDAANRSMKAGGRTAWGPQDYDAAISVVNRLMGNPEKEQPAKPAKPAELTPSGHRPLSTIAREIRRDWGPKVNYAAKPYLDALSSLYDIKDDYGADSAQSVVAYFLSNARGWKGDKAKEVKAELKKLIGLKKDDLTAEDMPEPVAEQNEKLCEDCRTPKACKAAGRCLIAYEKQADEDDEDEEDE